MLDYRRVLLLGRWGNQYPLINMRIFARTCPPHLHVHPLGKLSARSRQENVTMLVKPITCSSRLVLQQGNCSKSWHGISPAAVSLCPHTIFMFDQQTADTMINEISINITNGSDCIFLAYEVGPC